MARPYSLDLRERVAGFAVWRRRRHGGPVVSPASHDGQRCGAADGGVRRAVLAGERDWLLARIEEKPDLTLRAIQAELAVAGWW